MAGLLARIAREESASERTCVVTGEKGPPDAMLRFALSPEGVVTPDIRRKLPGRGVWTRLDRAVVARAAKGFARGCRRPVDASLELAAQVDALLLDDALRFLGMVNKAGLVVAGAVRALLTRWRRRVNANCPTAWSCTWKPRRHPAWSGPYAPAG